MVRSFQQAFSKHQVVYLAAVVSAALIGSGAFWAYKKLIDVPQYLILHYNREVGIDQTGDIWNIAGIVSFGALMVLANTLLALRLDKRGWFLGKLVAGATVVVSGLLFISLAAIISVN